MNIPVSSRRRRSRRALALLLAATGLLSTPGHAQLSGNYSVCAAGCDYSSLADAALDLNTNGVSGPVTISVSPGTHDLKTGVSFGNIKGASSANTITVAGAGRGRTLLTGTGNGNGAVVELLNSKYITLRDMTVENTYLGTGTKMALRFYYTENCDLIKSNAIMNTAGTAGSQYALYLYYGINSRLAGNTFAGGYYGLYNYCWSASATPAYGHHLIEHNRFVNSYYYGVYGFGGFNTIIRNNYIDSLRNPAYSYGIFTNVENGLKCYNNIIPGYNIQSAGVYISNPNFGAQDVSFEFYNNIIGPFSSSALVRAVYFTMASAAGDFNVRFYHNTVHIGPATAGPVFETTNPPTIPGGVQIRNNIFSRATADGPVAKILIRFLAKDSLTDNVFYAPDKGQTLLEYRGISYSDIKDFRKAAESLQVATGNRRIEPPYISATDLRLKNSAPVPIGSFIASAPSDLEGNARCNSYPPVGAHQPAGNKIYVAISKPTLHAPDSVYENSPFQVALSGTKEELRYHFYVNNIRLKDSTGLNFTPGAAGTIRLKVVALNCLGEDSVTMNIRVVKPAAAPAADFLASANAIEVGQTIGLSDMSANGPTAWKWSITPEYTPSLNGPQRNFIYVKGSSASSPNPQIEFKQGGRYTICLSVSNAQGANQICKTDYIRVGGRYNMGAAALVTDSSGTIYDNGGPAGTYLPAINGETLTIRPCPQGTVVAVVKSLDLQCGYDYLQLFDGPDANSPRLDPFTYNAQTTYGWTGMTGRPTGTCANIGRPAATDTFRAKSGALTLRFYADNSVNYDGFEIYYYVEPDLSLPRVKPSLSLTAPDTVCTNSVFSLVGKDASGLKGTRFLYDLDGDFDAFEAEGSAAVYVFPQPGTYEVTLIGRNCYGADTLVKRITAITPPKPKADFEADNYRPTVTDIVSFNTLTTGCYEKLSYTITPAAGTAGVAKFVNNTNNSSATPQVNFTDTGCYSVKLTVQSAGGKDSLTRYCYIRVRGPYCVPDVINLASDVGISRVRFGDIDNSSPQGQRSYTDYTAKAGTIVQPGQTLTLSIDRNTNANAVSFAAWIDWNANNDFTDTGERVAFVASTSSTQFSATVNVPSGIAPGVVVLRVAANVGNAQQYPCGLNKVGEYEDYKITIRPDQTPPVLTLLGPDTLLTEQGRAFKEPGAKAIDNVDGDISHKVTIGSAPAFNPYITGTYVFTYRVADRRGNMAGKQRVVRVVADTTAPALVVSGSDTIYVNVGATNYTDPVVVSAYDSLDGNLSAQVEKKGGPVNTDSLGTYILRYSVSDLQGNIAEIQRIIIVRDTVRPFIALQGNAIDTLEVNSSAYNDPGVRFADNHTGQVELAASLRKVSDLDITKPGIYHITYTLTDASGNSASITRQLVVADRQAPVIHLLGENPLTTEVNQVFIEPGYEVTDNGPLKGEVKIGGTLLAAMQGGRPIKLGSYTLTYTAEDMAGNKTTATRVVNVKDLSAPVIRLIGAPTANVCRWKNFTDAGYTLSDNYADSGAITVRREGNFTDSSTLREGMYSFRYVATDPGGNVGFSEYRFVTVLSAEQCGTTGISAAANLLPAGVQIYPNPSAGRFTVAFALPAEEQARVSLINTLGEELAVLAENAAVGERRFEADLSQSAAGIYFVRIVTRGGTLSRRVVITR